MNNKPNYAQGKTRYQIVNLLHITGIITPRTYKLFENHRTIANTMIKLKNENVVEKSNNTEVFENLVTTNYVENYEKHFEYTIPVSHLDFFRKYGKEDIKRAKYKKADAVRVIHNSEATAMMYAAGIPTLPEDKKYIVQNKKLTDNVYYQSREIRQYSGFAPDIQVAEDGDIVVSTSRINGTLLTAGGNFNIYNMGKSLSIWVAQGEYKLKNYIQNMLANYINQDTCMVDNAILFVYNLTTMLRLVNPDKKFRKSYDGLSMTYKNIYILPYDENGRDMLRIICEPNWKIRMYEEIMEETYTDTSLVDTVCDYYDGEAYTFVFCVPNFARYLDFIHKAEFINKPDRFRIICFDYQVEFIIKSAGKYASLFQVSFKDFIKDWNYKKMITGKTTVKAV